MTQFEYKEIYYSGNSDLEYLKNNDVEQAGKEGWEMVAVIRHPVHGYFIYYFKRMIVKLNPEEIKQIVKDHLKDTRI